MKKTATEENMELLHSALARALADRIADGSATASDLAVAAKFLKDNGISRLLSKDMNALGRAALEASPLPDPSDEPEDFEEAAHLYQ